MVSIMASAKHATELSVVLEFMCGSASAIGVHVCSLRLRELPLQPPYAEWRNRAVPGRVPGTRCARSVTMAYLPPNADEIRYLIEKHWQDHPDVSKRAKAACRSSSPRPNGG